MSDPQTPDEILDHYTSVQDEAARLRSGPDGTMEAIRTLELLDRFLPLPRPGSSMWEAVPASTPAA